MVMYLMYVDFACIDIRPAIGDFNYHVDQTRMIPKVEKMKAFIKSRI